MQTQDLWSNLRRALVALFSAWPAALRARLGVFARRRRAAAGGAVVVAALLLAACNGYTTDATNIVQQPDGSYSAQLNSVVSCGSNEHCSWYVHYRLVGTSTWTNVPSTPDGPVAGPISNVSLSENVTGLMVGQEYEYQVCENSQPGQPFICLGPDDTTNTTTKFTTGWAVETSPNTGPNGGSLAGVSCVSHTSCQAVGYYIDPNGRPATLIESWNGNSWTITPSPNGASYSALRGVSCVSATSCMAVGQDEGNDLTLVESWNGSAWTITPSPNGVGSFVGGGSDLRGVSCVSATSCQAVGYYGPAGPITDPSNIDKTLVESWNGSAWTITPSPNIASNPNWINSDVLNAVSCVSATSCQAVGYSNDSHNSHTFTESWNGTAWTISPSADYGPLFSVSCVSASSCMAVGNYVNASGYPQTLIESWNGSAWTISPSVNPETFDYLYGVSCTSATSCTAVGKDALIESWNGSAWTVSTSGAGIRLNGASCVSDTWCKAVGEDQSGILPQTFIAAHS
jgi:hypothetical protein